MSTERHTRRVAIIGENQERELVELPTIAMRLLGAFLSELAAGKPVNVVVIHADLTIGEAADLLNVTRSELAKRLATGAIPYTGRGQQRRIAMADLRAYATQTQARQSHGSNALASAEPARPS